MQTHAHVNEIKKKARSRSQWPRGLRRKSAITCLLGLRVRIPPGTWMPVSCEHCALSRRGACVGPISLEEVGRQEEEEEEEKEEEKEEEEETEE